MTLPTPWMPQQDAAAIQTLLAPKLAAFGKIAIGVTMGYMLILMLRSASQPCQSFGSSLVIAC